MWCAGCAGAERLKEALQALGLKAGGTLRQRAERLMLTKDTPLHQLDRKHFAPGSAPPVRPSLLACPKLPTGLNSRWDKLSLGITFSGRGVLLTSVVWGQSMWCWLRNCPSAADAAHSISLHAADVNVLVVTAERPGRGKRHEAGESGPSGGAAGGQDPAAA